jgi:hypothetical protein
MVSYTRAERKQLQRRFSHLRVEVEEMISQAGKMGDVTRVSVIEEMLEELQRLSLELGEHKTPLPEPAPLPAAPEKVAFPMKRPSLPETPASLALAAEIAEEEANLQAHIDSELARGVNAWEQIWKQKELKESRGTRLHAVREKTAPATYLEALAQYRVKEELHQNYLEAVADWEKCCSDLHNQHDRALERWQAARKKYADPIRERVVKRLNREWAELRNGGPAVMKVWWRFLPPSANGSFDIGPALLALREAKPNERVDEVRLRFAYSLNPRQVAVGQAEFDGYIAFLFPNTTRVLMECPFEGNAAYVFLRDWAALSRLSKRELLEQHGTQVRRVIHAEGGSWKNELRFLLS